MATCGYGTARPEGLVQMITRGARCRAAEACSIGLWFGAIHSMWVRLPCGRLRGACAWSACARCGIRQESNSRTVDVLLLGLRPVRVQGGMWGKGCKRGTGRGAVVIAVREVCSVGCLRAGAVSVPGLRSCAAVYVFGGQRGGCLLCQVSLSLQC